MIDWICGCRRQSSKRFCPKGTHANFMSKVVHKFIIHSSAFCIFSHFESSLRSIWPSFKSITFLLPLELLYFLFAIILQSSNEMENVIFVSCRIQSCCLSFCLWKIQIIYEITQIKQILFAIPFALPFGQTEQLICPSWIRLWLHIRLKS